MKGKVDPIKLKKFYQLIKTNPTIIRAKDTEKYDRNKKPEKGVENVSG